MFSAIATDHRHPQRSRSIYQCCKLQGDSFPLYSATGCGGGEGYSSAHAHVITSDPLPVIQATTSSAVETVLRHGRIFQGSDEVYTAPKYLVYKSVQSVNYHSLQTEHYCKLNALWSCVRSLCFIVLTRGIRFARLVYTRPWTYEIFMQLLLQQWSRYR